VTSFAWNSSRIPGRNKNEKKSASAPYWKLLGMELVERGPDYAKMKLKHREELTQGYGTFHGGGLPRWRTPR
jgi:acyl-coenzyme A thioesterase PaaI-like protein